MIARARSTVGGEVFVAVYGDDWGDWSAAQAWQGCGATGKSCCAAELGYAQSRFGQIAARYGHHCRYFSSSSSIASLKSSSRN